MKDKLSKEFELKLSDSVGIWAGHDKPGSRTYERWARGRVVVVREMDEPAIVVRFGPTQSDASGVGVIRISPADAKNLAKTLLLASRKRP